MIPLLLCFSPNLATFIKQGCCICKWALICSSTCAARHARVQKCFSLYKLAIAGNVFSMSPCKCVTVHHTKYVLPEVGAFAKTLVRLITWPLELIIAFSPHPSAPDNSAQLNYVGNVKSSALPLTQTVCLWSWEPKASSFKLQGEEACRIDSLSTFRFLTPNRWLGIVLAQRLPRRPGKSKKQNKTKKKRGRIGQRGPAQ